MVDIVDNGRDNDITVKWNMLLLYALSAIIPMEATRPMTHPHGESAESAEPAAYFMKTKALNQTLYGVLCSRLV